MLYGNCFLLSIQKIKSIPFKVFRDGTTSSFKNWLNCRWMQMFEEKKKHKCPFPWKYNTENVIHIVIVTLDKCVKTYVGSTRQSLKKRLYGYYFSFRIENPKGIPCKANRDSTTSSNKNWFNCRWMQFFKEE